MCNCFENGEYLLHGSNSHNIYLDLNNKTIDVEDCYGGWTTVLDINYCPKCGEKLIK